MLTPPLNKSDHTQGNLQAPVILVEYGDYECPYCGQAYQVIKEIEKNFGKNLLFVFRNFPLSEIHPHALAAAYAAEAAGLQGKFWQMHAMLCTHQDALTKEDLRRYAKELSLNGEQFEDDLQSQTVQDKVYNDFQSGIESGVAGTPTFFVNGNKILRYSHSTLHEAIESTMRASAHQLYEQQ